MLNGQQIRHFEAFGFLLLPQLFSAAELETIKAEFAEAMAAAYRHLPFDGSIRHWVPMMGSTTPFFAGLLENSCFCSIAEQLYGDDVLGIATDANRYVGDTRWHPDTHSVHQFGVKFAFYLESVGPETGALRVIPGSHLLPLHEELRESIPAPESVADVPAHVCTSEPGDVIAFDLRTWHASYGDRHMCTCVYYHNPKTADEEEALRYRANRNLGAPAQYHRPDDPLFDPHWIANPEGSPLRQRWLDRMDEFGFFATA